MCTYLEAVGSTYYFRHMVPAELRPFIRTKSGAVRTEFKISLATKDRGIAKRLIPDHVKVTDAVFDEARQLLTAKLARNGAPEPPASKGPLGWPKPANRQSASCKPSGSAVRSGSL